MTRKQSPAPAPSPGAGASGSVGAQSHRPATRIETIGDCTLYLGDCRDVLPTLGPVDAVVTDPPYGLNFAYDTYDDAPENLPALIDAVMPEILRVGRRSVITPGVTNVHAYPRPNWTGVWTWETTSTFGQLGFNQWQPILFYGKDVDGFGSVNGLLKSDRLHFSGGGVVPAHGALAKAHCCPKPPGVMLRMVQRFSMPGETVCDPFMGSGTTGVACASLGRSFVGIEISPAYFDIACRRIEEAYRQPRLFAEPEPKPVQSTISFEVSE